MELTSVMAEERITHFVTEAKFSGGAGERGRLAAQ